jgi:SAM-dependent methyltransferase
MPAKETGMTDQPLTDKERTLPEHLGGHFGNTNMDIPTLDYLANRYAIHSMLDVGCGPGGMIDAARARGIDCVGIDGDYTIEHPYMTHWDYTTAPLIWGQKEDLIWCTEFVEHVAIEHTPNYLATFACGRVLFLTAAPPGFPGWHHVNCQPDWHWIGLLGVWGWQLDGDATEWVRANGGHVFSQRQGLVFTRES